MVSKTLLLDTPTRRLLAVVASLLLLATMACEPASEPWTTDVPAGELESARRWDRLLVKGWAADRNTDESIYVAFYVDGVLQHGLTLANERRSDVLAATGRAEFSGFSRWLDVSDSAKKICVSAVNEGSGDHALLGCQDVSNSGGIVGSQVRGWGAYGLGQLGEGGMSGSGYVSRPVDGYMEGALAGRELSQISAGDSHTCAIADERAFCWGSNSSGQLGIGAGNSGDSSTMVPTSVKRAGGALNTKPVASISAGFGHSCAVADGGVFCWGANDRGQLGNGTSTGSRVPVRVLSAQDRSFGSAVREDSPSRRMSMASQVSAGTDHSCAVADGEAFCWGANDRGQLGNGTFTDSPVPVKVATVGTALEGRAVTGISAGQGQTCAVADRNLICWGRGGSGQLGNGGNADSNVPVAVISSGALDNRNVDSVSSGSGFSCAIADAAAFCWGRNDFGQLGNGTNSSSNVPVEVTTDDTPIEGHRLSGISAGKSHVCVGASGVDLSDRVSCWGSNDNGQLGIDPRTGVAASNLPTGSELLNFFDLGGVGSVATGGAHTVMFSSGFLADSPPR